MSGGGSNWPDMERISRLPGSVWSDGQVGKFSYEPGQFEIFVRVESRGLSTCKG